MEKNSENGLYLYLEKICPSRSNTNVEIIIESETFKRTETDYECNSDDYGKHYNKIYSFDEYRFDILALGHTLNIPYEILDSWGLDKVNPDKSTPNKIHLHLKKAVVLYPRKKLKLEDNNVTNNYVSANFASVKLNNRVNPVNRGNRGSDKRNFTHPAIFTSWAGFALWVVLRTLKNS